MSKTKCSRCGKVIELNAKTARKQIKCPHCNLVMTQDKKTTRLLMFAKFIYMFVFIVLVSFIYSLFSEGLDNLISILIIMFAGLISAGTSDFVADWLVFKLFGKSYIQS